LAVAECSNNTGPPANLFHDPLEWIVGSDLLPVDVGKGVVRGAIAQAIGRPKSTVWRANSPTTGCRAGATRRIERDRALRTFVVDRLAEGWTPEQISGRLKGGNEPALRAVGCETIYAFIYRAGQQAEQLWRYLTRRHKRRRPRRSRPPQDTIKDRVSIHQRPKKVDARTERAATGRVTSSARLAGKTGRLAVIFCNRAFP
jgi:IS30 family transposase